MPSRIFRFYSLEPEAVFHMAGERWPAAIVRRSGWKVSGSPIFYVTLVLDDDGAAAEFERWLGQNAPRTSIRRYVGRAGRDLSSSTWDDVQFHRGGLRSRVNLSIDTFRSDVARYWFGARRLALGLWLRLRS